MDNKLPNTVKSEKGHRSSRSRNVAAADTAVKTVAGSPTTGTGTSVSVAVNEGCSRTGAADCRDTDRKKRSSHTEDQSVLEVLADGAEAEDSPTESKEDVELFECAICLQTCVHPVQLPCSHIFCFLCVKGVAIQSKRCALCRQDIPIEFFNNPALLRREDLLKETSHEGGCQWYYQGVHGWWQYDERASSELEAAYQKQEKTLEILIAGFLYHIDFENMLQYRRNDPSRRRKVKRDLITIPDRKGVAGLKILSSELASPHRREGDGGENVPCVVQQQPAVTSSVSLDSPGSPEAPHNSPQTTPYVSPSTTAEPASASQELSTEMASLSLQAEPTDWTHYTHRPRLPKPQTRRSTQQDRDHDSDEA